MKHKYVLLFLFFTVNLTKSIAQQEQFLKFTYINFCDSVDTDYKNFGFLISKGSQSYFFTYPYDFKKLGMQIVDSTPGNKRYVYYDSEDTVKRFIVKDFVKSEIIFETKYWMLMKEKKIYSDSLHNINWQISIEKMKIDSFYCTKATAIFRGRIYTAWFDESISLSNGPWKFGGLPGLIIQISDETKTVFWRLQKIQQVNYEPLPLLYPFDGNYISYQRDLKEAYKKRKKAIESHGSVSDPSCLTCTGSTTYRLNPVEIFFDENQ